MANRLNGSHTGSVILTGSFGKRAYIYTYTAILIGYLLLASFSAYWLAVIQPHPWADDFGIYYRGLLAFRAGQSPYFPYAIGTSFVSHPFVLALVGLFSVAGEEVARIAWPLANAVAYGASVVIALRLITPRPAGEGPTLRTERVWLLAAFLLGFAPFWEMVQVGQINGFVLLALLLSLHLAEGGHPVVAGLMLGLAITLKTSPLIFLLYFAAVRRYRVVIAGVITVVALTLVAWGLFGSQVLAGFLEVVSSLRAAVHPDSYNQSLPAFMVRVAAALGKNGPALSDVERTLSPGSRLVLGGLLVALSGSGFLIRGRGEQAGELRVELFALLCILMTVASPLVWYHHSVFLILPLAVLAGQGAGWRLALGVALMLLIQSERAFEYLAPAWPYEYITPTAHLAGSQALSGLPVLLAQYGLLGVLGGLYAGRLAGRSAGGYD